MLIHVLLSGIVGEGMAVDILDIGKIKHYKIIEHKWYARTKTNIA